MQLVEGMDVTDLKKIFAKTEEHRTQISRISLEEARSKIEEANNISLVFGGLRIDINLSLIHI